MRDKLEHGIEELEHFVEDKVPFYLKRYWRWPAIGIAALVVPLAIGLWVFRWVAPQVPEYRTDAEAFATRTLGWPVEIERMWLGWHWFGPEVVMQGVRVLAPDGSARVLIRAERVRVGVAPGDFLRGGAFRPARVVFERPKVALEVTPAGKVLLAGEQVGDLTQPAQDWRPLLKQLLAHGRVEVADGDFTWHDKRGSLGRVHLAPVQMALESDGDDHEAELDVALPEELGKRLRLEIGAEGDAGAPETWAWEGTLDAEGVRMDWLQTRLRPAALYRPTGVVDLDAEVAAVGSELHKLVGRVLARGITVGPRGEVVQFKSDGSGIDLVDARFDWRREGQAWQLGIEDLSVRRGTRAWKSDGLHLEFAPGTDIARFAGDAALIRLEDLALFASWLPKEVFPYTADLLDVAPHGDVRGLEFELGLVAGAPRDWRVKANLSQVGFSRRGKVPGLDGLSGALDARQSGGSFALAATPFRIDLGQLFRTPLGIAAARGAFRWTQDAAGLTLQSDDLALDDPRAKVRARFVFRAPPEGSPHLDLTGTLEDGDLSHKSTFLPVGIMKPALIEWLDRAVVAGRIPQARFTLKGPLRSFPFRDGSGTFEVVSKVEGGVLAYSQTWPRAEAVRADLVFRQQGIFIADAEGRAAGVPFRKASASLADPRLGLVEVTAEGSGPAEGLAGFVRQSPLNARFETLLDELKVRGPTRTRMAVQIPVKDTSLTKVQVETTLAGARADLVGLPFGARKLHGVLHFTENSARAERIRGELLGAPLSIVLGTDADGTTRLDLTGQVGAEPLARALKLPLERVLEGATPVAARVRVPPRGSPAPLTVEMDTRLIGLAVGLPAPLGKPAEAPTLTQARLEFADRDSMAVHVAYGEHARARYEFVRRERAWGLVGDDAAHLDVTAPLVDVAAWLEHGAHGPDAAPLNLPFRTLGLRAERLEAWGQRLANASVQLERFNDAWSARVAAPEAEGTVRVPDDLKAFPVEADFERLWLSPVAQAVDPAAGDSSVDPRSLPAMTVRIGSLRFAGADLGAVDAVIEKRPWGLALTSFDATSPSFELKGDGRWEMEEGRTRTRIAARLVSSGVGRTMVALGFPAAVEAQSGTLDFALDWPGGPASDVPDKVSGTVKLEIGTGRLRDVSPGGASRALGLFSLGALPRRLTLDFRDVVREGLAFDSVRGDFLIDQGQAYTTNLRLEGANLKMVLVGRTGLGTRDYDQLATIDTSLGATLPVAGALAGGPAVAAAALIVSQLFKRTLADATRVHYRITGPWDAPKVERATAEEAQR